MPSMPGVPDRAPGELPRRSRELNLASWNERVAAHVASADYAVARLAADPDFLSGVVSFDRPRLGDIGGLRALHLQCHIGTDTLSLAKLGARMAGLDFSAPALAQARSLAHAAGIEIEYVEGEVDEAVELLGEGRFELLYTGIGAICWLPSITRWARAVATLLAPGGRLFMREGHPMLWALEERRDDALLVVEYPYFERAEPFEWVEEGTYVHTDARFEHNTTHTWSHGLGEIVQALLDEGMEITALQEHDSVPWEALEGLMEKIEDGSCVEYRLADRPWRVPHSYTLQALKPR